jgi:hypothetical protein
LAATDLQQAMLHGSQKRAVGRIVDVTLHHRRVGAQLAPPRCPLLARQAYNPLMNLFGHCRTQHRKGTAESAEIRRGLGVEAGELPVHQVAADLAL